MDSSAESVSQVDISELTPHQRVFLQAAEDEGFGQSITKLCEIAGVSRISFYAWIKQPEFRAAWRDAAARPFDASLHQVAKKLIDLALGGNLEACKLILTHAGVLKQAQAQQSVDINLAIQAPALRVMPEAKARVA